MQKIISIALAVLAVIVALWVLKIIGKLLFWGLVIAVIVFVLVPMLRGKTRR